MNEEPIKEGPLMRGELPPGKLFAAMDSGEVREFNAALQVQRKATVGGDPKFILRPPGEWLYVGTDLSGTSGITIKRVNIDDFSIVETIASYENLYGTSSGEFHTPTYKNRVALSFYADNGLPEIIRLYNLEPWALLSEVRIENPKADEPVLINALGTKPGFIIVSVYYADPDSDIPNFGQGGYWALELRDDSTLAVVNRFIVDENIPYFEGGRRLKFAKANKIDFDSKGRIFDARFLDHHEGDDSRIILRWDVENGTVYEKEVADVDFRDVLVDKDDTVYYQNTVRDVETLEIISTIDISFINTMVLDHERYLYFLSANLERISVDKPELVLTNSTNEDVSGLNDAVVDRPLSERKPEQPDE